MVIPNGTRDALSALADLAVREGRNIPPRWLDPTQKDFRPDIIGRRGSAVDGGETGRLVLLGATRQDGSEIAVRWCNTGEPILPFTKLD